LQNVESCLFGQGRTLNQVYYVRNKHGQGCVNLRTENSLNFGPTIGSTPTTKLQFTECSLTSSVATQNLLLEWIWQTWLLALPSTDVDLEGWRFQNIEDVHENVIALKDILQEEFHKCFHQRQHHQAVQLLKRTNPKPTPPVKVYVCRTTCNKINAGTLQPRLVLYA
jgi:hypothetical protein